MQVNTRTPWESPTQYVGKLPTSGKGVGVVVMDEGFDLSHPDLKGNVVGVATNQGDTFESDPLGHGTHTLGVVGSTGSSSQGAIRGVAPNATLGLSYRGNFGEDATSNGVTGRFAVRF